MKTPTEIAELLDSLGEEGSGAVSLRLGEDANEVVGALADEAERRILADLERGMAWTGAVVDLADRVASAGTRARARRAQAQALAYANRFDEALAVLRSAVELARGEGDELEAARARMTMLHALARQGRFDEAIRVGHEAREAFVAAKEGVLAARADMNLGVCERMRDNPARALEHFARARDEVAGVPLLLGPLESNSAEALLDLDRFADAEAAFGRALGAFESAGAARGAGIVLGNLADVASRQGRLHDAMEYFERARRTLGDVAAPGDAARLRVEHADVLASLGMHVEAAESYAGAMGVLDAHQMTPEGARARCGLGRSLVRLGRGEEGEARLLEAEAAFSELKHDTGIARVHTAMAEREAARLRYQHAHEHLVRARRVVESRPALAAQVDLAMASAALVRGMPDEALAHANAGLATARQLALTSLAGDLLQARAAAHRARGELVHARDDLRDAVGLLERVRGRLQHDQFRAAFVADRYAVWEECATTTLDLGGAGAPGEAFELVERAKARSLLELVRTERVSHSDTSRATGDSIETGLLRELDGIIGELNALYDGSKADGDGIGGRRGRAERIREREARAAELQRRLGATGTFGGAFADPEPLARVQRTIPQDGAIVEFFTEGADLSVMVMKRSAVEVRRRTANVSAIRARLDAMNFQVGRAISRGIPGGARGARLAEDVEHELATLGELILAPILDAISGVERIAFVPAGPVHGVPLGALRVNGERLMSRTSTTISPSASVLCHLPPRRGARALIVGVADEHAPRAEDEARVVAQGVPGALLLCGASATRGEVSRAMTGAGLVHIASHARFIASNPGASGVKLADGWLTARDIMSINLAGAEVVLSGCDTGRAVVKGGDEVLGLTRAFLAAGASMLVQTLWALHDESAARIMARAYGVGYGEGALRGERRFGLGEGIRRAQVEEERSDRHAAAWAGFVTVGAPW